MYSQREFRHRLAWCNKSVPSKPDPSLQIEVSRNERRYLKILCVPPGQNWVNGCTIRMGPPVNGVTYLSLLLSVDREKGLWIWLSFLHRNIYISSQKALSPLKVKHTLNVINLCEDNVSSLFRLPSHILKQIHGTLGITGFVDFVYRPIFYRTKCFGTGSLCSLEHRTIDKVQQPSNPECYTPSSEPFKIY
jgi:hypothetical protein